MRAMAAAIGLALALCVATTAPRTAHSRPAPGTVRDTLAADVRQSLERALKESRLAEAESTARALLDRLESRGRSLAAAQALDYLVEALWRGGKSQAAGSKELAERVVRQKENLFGANHAEMATSLNNQAILLYMRGDYAEAGPLHERALAIREQTLGPEHPNVAKSLINLAAVRTQMGELESTRPLYERALAIQEKALGSEHPDLGHSLTGLGLLHWQSGRYALSAPLFERALAIQQKATGRDRGPLATTLSNLAGLRYAMGEYAESRSLYERALAIREELLGPEHPAVADLLARLGLVLWQTGDHAAALPLYERALANRERKLKPEHPSRIESLHDLALLRHDLGDLEQARVLYEQVLASRERTLGPRHGRVAEVLTNLANLLSEQGDQRAAVPLYERALEIREESLGLEHPKVGLVLTNLADSYFRMGDLAKARELYDRALATSEKALPPDHIDIASELGGLARVVDALGESERALQLYERATRVTERSLGVDHPRVVPELVQWGAALAAAGRSHEAFEAALRAERIGREHLRLTARVLPEHRAMEYAAFRKGGLDLAILMAAGPIAGDPEVSRRTWDAVIRSRALVLDEMASRHRVLAGGDSAIARAAADFRTSRRRLAGVIVRGQGDSAPEGFRALVDSARRESEALERVLAARSAAFREERARVQVGFADLASALPRDAALVAFLRYQRPRDSARLASPGPGAAEGAARYAVFVQRHAESDPALLPLGDGDAIDSLVRKWMNQVTRAALLPTSGDAASREAGAALRRAIWDPVVSRLGGARKVFIVPDGALWVVNFGALPVDGSRYLIENRAVLHYLSTERDLIDRPSPAYDSDGLLAIGGPDFEAQPSELLAAGALQGSLSPETHRGSRASCGDFRSRRFRALPQAAREVNDLAILWDQALQRGRVRGARITLAGVEATETAFKTRAPGKRTIHLATHGFFLEERCAADDNPLYLSGIVLAGANRRDQVGPSHEDGILTAEEVATLDLSGLECGVLSACETGIGVVRTGEGVLGLRRAFQIAGARTLVMSLWEVEDEAARQWMGEFYARRIHRGDSTAEAVRAASLKALRDRRSRRENTNPFYWAAFVAAGDWR